MKSIVLAAAALLVLGFAGTSSAGIMKGPALEQHLSDFDNVHCRRYPHRHRKATPHGFGFGCPKRPRTPQRKG
jgi:hypothetical protein